MPFSVSFVNAALLLEHYDLVKDFLNRSPNKKSKEIMSILRDHEEEVLRDLRALSLTWELVKFFWSKTSKFMARTEFGDLMKIAISCRDYLQSEEPQALTKLVDLVDRVQLRTGLSEIESDALSVDRFRSVCLSGMTKFCNIMRSEQMKEVADTSSMESLSFSNVTCESTFAKLKWLEAMV